VATANGELDTALAFGEEAYGVRESVGFLWIYTATLGWAFPESLFQAGDPERARNVMTEMVGGKELPGFMPSMQCRIMEVLSRAELALGHRQEAATWAVRAEEIANGVNLSMSAAFARRASAAVALANGEHHRAVQFALDSADAAERVNARLEAARSRLLAGIALGHAGPREEAVAELSRAESELAACGAQGYRAEAARELRRLGRRVAPGRRGMIGVESLTPRELEVAELVAARKSTREIAAQLFVSPKTVESHLGHIFAKLGVSSRMAVGPALRRA
jgi:DNA-binding CsgD family transcriptional regulator